MKELRINKYLLYWVIIVITCWFTILPRCWHAITFSKTIGEVRHFGYYKIPYKRGYRIAWYPIVDFSLENKNYSFLGSDVQHDELNRGDKVELIYNPKNPSDAYIYSWLGFWAPPLVYFIPIFIIVSGFLLSVGFLPRVLVIKLKK